jgi:hypothetical protein
VEYFVDLFGKSIRRTAQHPDEVEQIDVDLRR